jgi:serine/threonine protein kinase
LEPAQVLIVRAEVATWRDPQFKSLGTADADPNALQAAEHRLQEWLISHDLLTSYQAHVLRTGLRGPLNVGPLGLVGQLADWGLPHHYWGTLKGSTAHPQRHDGGTSSPHGLLAFAQGATADDWAAIRRQVDRLISAFGRSVVPQLLIPWGTLEDPPRCAVLWPAYRGVNPGAPGDGVDADGAGSAGTDDIQSLAQRLSPETLQAGNRPSTKRILQFALDVAVALQALHEKQLVVGALNPAAVVMANQKRAAVWSLPVACLRTPGLAAALYGTNAGQSNPVAWPEALLKEFRSSRQLGWRPIDFLPPEQLPNGSALGEGPTATGDLYALGRLIYWMFGGASAEPARDWTAARAAKQDPNDGQLPDSVPSPISKWVAKLLCPDPSQRPGSAAEVQRTLLALLKRPAESTGTLFFVNSAAAGLQRAAETWPERCWTPAVENVHSEDLPTLVQAVEAPRIVIDPRGSEKQPGQDASPGTAAPMSENGGSTSFRSLRHRGPQKRPIWSAPLISCVVSGSAALVVLLWWLVASPPTTPPQANNRPGDEAAGRQVPEVEPGPDASLVAKPTGWEQQVVPDDGRMLWESPTVGRPVEVGYLPNSPTGLLVIQREFWQSPACEPLLRVWEGPQGSGQAETIKRWRAAFSVDRFDRMVSAQYQSLEGVQHAIVLESDTPVQLSLPGWKLIAAVNLTDAGNPPRPADQGKPDGDDQRETPLGEQPLFHFLLTPADNRDGGGLGVWIQLTTVPGAWGQDLPTISAERLTAEVFDPAAAETALEETPLQVRRLVIAPPELLKAALVNQGETMVPGTLANLLASSDRDRHAQVFFNPVTVWNAQGQDWLGPRWLWMGQLIKDRVPTSVRMMSVSAHWLDSGESYVEAKFVADRSPSAVSAVGPIMNDLLELPQQVKRSLLDLPRVAYWENALLRYDDMLQDASSLVRAGQHDKLPTLNAWLRPRALENLVATTELYWMAVRLSQGEAIGWAGSEGGSPAEPRGEVAGVPQTLEELLRQPRRLDIPEQDLINALAELTLEIKTAYPELPFEFSIELDGNALRLEGITQNQKVTNFKMENRSLADILTALVLKANPDPAVTSARDPQCKLIWLIDPARPGGQIRVSTRAAAAANAWTLPAEVTPE